MFPVPASHCAAVPRRQLEVLVPGPRAPGPALSLVLREFARLGVQLQAQYCMRSSYGVLRHASCEQRDSFWFLLCDILYHKLYVVCKQYMI